MVFGKVCTEEEESLSDEFAIRAIPTLMIFKDGIKVYSKSEGMSRGSGGREWEAMLGGPWYRCWGPVENLGSSLLPSAEY